MTDSELAYYILCEYTLNIDANIKRCENPKPSYTAVWRMNNRMCCDYPTIEYYISIPLWESILKEKKLFTSGPYIYPGYGQGGKLNSLTSLLLVYIDYNLEMGIFKLPALSVKSNLNENNFIAIYGFQDHPNTIVEVEESFNDFI